MKILVRFSIQPASGIAAVVSWITTSWVQGPSRTQYERKWQRVLEELAGQELSIAVSRYSIAALWRNNASPAVRMQQAPSVLSSYWVW